MTAVSSTKDSFKMETLGDISRKDVFDDIRPAQPITEEHDNHNYDLISVCILYFSLYRLTFLRVDAILPFILKMIFQTLFYYYTSSVQ